MIRRIVLLSALAGATACGGSSKGDSATPAGGDPCGGGTGAEDFSGWDGWTRVNDARFVSKGHNKAWVDVYVEGAGLDVYRAKGDAYPVGTRLVKAQFETEDAATPQALTVMQKMEVGYDDDNGNWYYGVYDPAGAKAMKSGAIEMCINCHVQVEEQDWVFGPQ